VAVSVTVRPATASDVDGALAVFEAVVDEGAWMGTEPGFDPVERRERFAASVGAEGRAFLVAADAGAVVGMLVMEVAPFGVAGMGMCVAPGWRRRGVGGALLAGAIAAARRLGAHKIGLEVWPHNEAAIRLYQRHGFVVEGRRRRHYRRRDGELWDSVMMGLVLDDDEGAPA